ncbi:unnamed protein product, partial [Medioppia subpectinata]
MIRTRDTDLTTEQVQVIRHTFDTFDPAHKSYLPYDTVEYMVRIMRVATGKDLQFIVANADTNGDQRIQFDEFLALAERFLIEEGPDVVAQDLRQAFDTYNTDSDGMISDADMKEILRAMDVELTADELDVLVDQLDRDGSGSVHFNELTTVYFSYPNVYSVNVKPSTGLQLPAITICTERDVFFDKTRINNELGLSNEYEKWKEK